MFRNRCLSSLSFNIAGSIGNPNIAWRVDECFNGYALDIPMQIMLYTCLALIYSLYKHDNYDNKPGTWKKVAMEMCQHYDVVS